MILPGPGAAPQIHPLEPSDPEELGGYPLLGRIGAGGMGVVYLAETRTGRRLALKAILKEYVRDVEFRTRFRREAAAAMKVRGRFLATLIDADPDGDQPWLAVEYVEGPALTAVVQSSGPLAEPELRTMLSGVAEALRSVHQSGIVHRDLKPSNILIGQDGPYVIDFGIAQASDSTSLTRTGLKVGTPAFMAPEQVRGSASTPAADIWALGALALYAATGQRAFGEGDTTAVYYRVVHEDPDLSTCPEWLLPLVRACLAKDPDARPNLQEILDFLNGVPAEVRTATTKITGPGAEPATDPQGGEPDDATVLRPGGALTADEVQNAQTPPDDKPARRRLSQPMAWIVGAAAVLVVGGIVTAVALGMPSGTPEASGSASPSASASAAAIDECLVGKWRLDELSTSISLADQQVDASGFEGRVTEFRADGTQLVTYDDAQPLRAQTSVGEYTETWSGTATYPVETKNDTLKALGVNFSDVSAVKAVAGKTQDYQPNGGTPNVQYTCDETTYTEKGANKYEATYSRMK